MKKSGRGVELFPVWGDYGSSRQRIWNLSHYKLLPKKEKFKECIQESIHVVYCPVFIMSPVFTKMLQVFPGRMGCEGISACAQGDCSRAGIRLHEKSYSVLFFEASCQVDVRMLLELKG